LQDGLEVAGSGATLPSDLEVGSSGFGDRMKGIRVRSTGENPISVLVIMKYPSFSVNGYSAFPLHTNSEFDGESIYEYFGVSTDYTGSTALNRRSSILLVGNFDATTVSITPTQNVCLPADAQAESPLVDVIPGTTRNVTLYRFQTLLVSSLTDLTGTKILSTRPLTIITGHQCAQVPSTSGFCEPLYIHIPPTVTWGQRFLLPPFAGRDAPQIYRVIASRNSTIVAHRCDNLDNTGIEIAEAGDSFAFSFPGHRFCYLIATNPVFVVKIASGFLVDGSGDPAVTIISPTIGYINSTTFSNILPNKILNNFISVTVQAQHFNESQIHLDGRKLPCNWNVFYEVYSDSIAGYGCSLRITNGTHTVSHSEENGLISVVTYGWNSRPALGYAYLTGINLEVSEPNTGI
jgi:hypothetical protein